MVHAEGVFTLGLGHFLLSVFHALCQLAQARLYLAYVTDIIIKYPFLCFRHNPAKKRSGGETRYLHNIIARE